jgi:hypothetical protein
MKAIVYYVLLMNHQKDSRRAKQLDFFLMNNDIDVISTYYDVFAIDLEHNRLGMNALIKDVTKKIVEADALIVLSVKDLGKTEKAIPFLTDITNFIPNIFFVDIETSNMNI